MTRALAGALLGLSLITAGCTRSGRPAVVASAGATTAPPSTTPTSSPKRATERRSHQTAPHRGAPKPSIVWKPIPFPYSRKLETAAYARRHYGLDTYRLIHPRAVVEHFTVTSTFGPVYNTFASNAPDLGELPGTCAHFVVDRDGTIYQLVPLSLMCRHASGMNYTAIGIEMVGFSDSEILANRKELGAALRLTLWLMAKFGIALRNVIGHNENLTSPLRIERVASFRCQTHGDWSHEHMEVFRAKLERLANHYGVAIGPPAERVDIGC